MNLRRKLTVDYFEGVTVQKRSKITIPRMFNSWWDYQDAGHNFPEMKDLKIKN